MPATAGPSGAGIIVRTLSDLSSISRSSRSSRQPKPIARTVSGFSTTSADEGSSSGSWVHLLRLMGKSPHLVACTPKMMRHQRVLRPHASALLPHIDRDGKHLPRILDHIDSLGPHLGRIIPLLPTLSPFLPALLDALPAFEAHVGIVVAHAEDLLPSLPYIAPSLPQLRPYLADLALHLPALAPHTKRLAPQLHVLLPHLPTLVPLLDALAPHLDVLTEESTLHRLLEHADHVAGRLTLMGPKLRTLLPADEPDASGLLLNALLAGAEKKKPGRAGRAPSVSAGAPNGHGAAASGASGPGLFGSIKRMFGPKNEPSDVMAAPAAAEDGPDLTRVNAESAAAEERMRGLEREFRQFKERAMWAKQRDHREALKVSRAEERLLEVATVLAVLVNVLLLWWLWCSRFCCARSSRTSAPSSTPSCARSRRS